MLASSAETPHGSFDPEPSKSLIGGRVDDRNMKETARRRAKNLSEVGRAFVEFAKRLGIKRLPDQNFFVRLT